MTIIGTEVVNIYNTFNLDTEERNDIELILKNFEDYFAPNKNESFVSWNFFRLRQAENDSFDEFLTEAETKIAKCNFGELTYGLLRDKIVFGVYSDQVREKLLAEEELTLIKAIQICRTSEQASKQMLQLRNSDGLIDRVQVKKQHERSKCNQNDVNSLDCKRCGIRHQARSCPAFGKRCLRCKKVMKISVRVRGEWFAVPCIGRASIRWLGDEALRRYQKLKPIGSHVPGREESVYQIRKTKGGAILDPDDEVRIVLDDNDFISVVLETDKESPVTGPAEIHYVPEQVPGKFKIPSEFLVLDGYNLTPEDLLRLGKGLYKIKLSTESVSRITHSRRLLETILKENKVAYGVNTGFGKFANTVISDDKIIELQENLVRSHSAGVGQPLTPEKTRMLMALRINVLAKGYSGISLDTLMHVVNAFNASCLPWVPEKGTVGASGDLAPLAHLALGMTGEGKMWSPESGWGEAKYVLESHNLKPVCLKAKEGIALLNGTQLITSIGAEAVQRAENVARQADVVAALTLEVLKGTTRAFDGDIQKVRPHRGQSKVAKRLRALLHSDTHPSEMAESHRFCNKVQDAYTLRCCPQVHGICHDTIEFVRDVITTEMNSATDNPLVFTEREEIISGGNFHGEYPAKALDYLAIGVHELASMSERRTERLINPALSGLPAFLVNDGGLNSGFMMAHCTAAALVSENKVLCHPASVDSLPTSAGTEDHVSMGGFAARKSLMVVENVERVIAIELLTSCQAIEFLRPLKTTAPLEAVYSLVRSVVKPLDKDRFMAPDIDAVTEMIKEEKVWYAVKPHMDRYFMEQGVETRPSSPTTSTSIAEKKRRLSGMNGNGQDVLYISDISYVDEDLNLVHKIVSKNPRIAVINE